MPPPGAPEWWVSGRTGTLSPWSQAKVFALVKISAKKGLDLADWEIAAEVEKVGGGVPADNTIRLWREKFEADPQWYPGKQGQDAEKPGRKKVITKQQEATIAQSAMSLKRKGVEPTVSAVVAQCPAATLNPETGEAFTAKVILEVFKTRCYDNDPEFPWQHVSPKCKTALTPELKVHRATWGETMLAKRHHRDWYYRHVLWMDPCHTILPGRPKTEFDQRMASYGKGDRWMSEDARDDSRNLRSSPYVNKTLQWGDKRIWWYVFLTQGKVYVEVLPDGWSQWDGQAAVVSMLPRILKKMLGKDATHPEYIFTDRGPGYYHPSSGTISSDYLAALDKHGFKPWAGEHSKWQPPDLPDVLLHETAVSWIRKYLKQHPVKLVQSVEENTRRVTAVLGDACEHINTYYEVDNLCHSLPDRLKALVDKQGERLKH